MEEVGWREAHALPVERHVQRRAAAVLHLPSVSPAPGAGVGKILAEVRRDAVVHAAAATAVATMNVAPFPSESELAEDEGDSSRAHTSRIPRPGPRHEITPFTLLDETVPGEM